MRCGEDLHRAEREMMMMMMIDVLVYGVKNEIAMIDLKSRRSRDAISCSGLRCDFDV